MTTDNKIADTKVTLKKSISLISACAIIIGSIIGSGIFISPNSVLQDAGTPGVSLIIWLISGLISLTGAICYTELGTMMQASGGDYEYINESYGSLLSFLYMWTMIFLCFPCLNGIAAVTVAEYTIKLFYNQDCHDSDISIKLIAALTLCILGFINSFNLKFVNRIQVSFTAAKVGALLLVIGAGIYSAVSHGQKTTEIVENWFPKDVRSIQYGQAAIALYSGLYTYSGWNCLNFLTEEMENPSRNLPLAIFIALPVIIIIYLVTNLAYYVVLTPEEILNSVTVALTFSEKVFPPQVYWLTPLFIAFSSFGSLLCSIMTTSRIYYAAARDGNLPNMFAMISIQYFSPITSIILTTITSILMLFLGDVKTLILYGTFTEFLFIGISISTIIYLRKKKPDIKRPIKLWLGIPIFFLLICVAINGLTFYQYPKESISGIIFMLVGVPIYYIGKFWRPKTLTKILNKSTVCIQKLFLCSKED